jgi:hypothetical protein
MSYILYIVSYYISIATCLSYNVSGLENEVLKSIAFLGYCHSLQYFPSVDFCGISLEQVKTYYGRLKLVFCIIPKLQKLTDHVKLSIKVFPWLGKYIISLSDRGDC